jgi:hypothetical protein
MHQDMKNFYDLTIIDVSDKLKVKIKLIEHKQPEYVFTVNEWSVGTYALLNFGLLDNLKFKCEVQKGAVEIEKITINDKEVLPLYLHLAEPKTSWITDTWCFEINQPFYPWYHKITGQGWIA